MTSVGFLEACGFAMGEGLDIMGTVLEGGREEAESFWLNWREANSLGVE